MNKKIILYIIAGILVLGLAFITLFPGMVYAIKDSESGQSEDVCTAPEGYTQEAWETHMSHHPNVYAECLT